MLGLLRSWTQILNDLVKYPKLKKANFWISCERKRGSMESLDVSYIDTPHTACLCVLHLDLAFPPQMLLWGCHVAIT